MIRFNLYCNNSFKLAYTQDVNHIGNVVAIEMVIEVIDLNKDTKYIYT